MIINNMFDETIKYNNSRIKELKFEEVKKSKNFETEKERKFLKQPRLIGAGVKNIWNPTWEGATTDPAIGNGTINAIYYLLGERVLVSIYVTMGATTTYGSGEWTFDLPIEADVTNGINYIGSVYILDNGTTHDIGVCRITDSNTIKMYVKNSSSIRSNVPHTWAANDLLILTIRYLKA